MAPPANPVIQACHHQRSLSTEVISNVLIASIVAIFVFIISADLLSGPVPEKDLVSLWNLKVPTSYSRVCQALFISFFLSGS